MVIAARIDHIFLFLPFGDLAANHLGEALFGFVTAALDAARLFRTHCAFFHLALAGGGQNASISCDDLTLPTPPLMRFSPMRVSPCPIVYCQRGYSQA